MPDFKLGEAYVELTTRGSVKPGLEREKDAADAAATEFRTASADITRSAEAIAAATQRAKAVAELKAPPGPGTVGFDQRPKPGALTPDESLREDKENARKRREAEQERQRTLKSDPDYVASLEMKQAEFRAQVRESRRAQDPEYDRKEALREEREKQRDAATEHRRAAENTRGFGDAVRAAGRALGPLALAAGGVAVTARMFDRWHGENLSNVQLSNPGLALRSEMIDRDLRAVVGKAQEGAVAEANARKRLMADVLQWERPDMERKLGKTVTGIYHEIMHSLAPIPGFSRLTAWWTGLPDEARGKSVGAAPNPMLGHVFGGDDFYRAFSRAAIMQPFKVEPKAPPAKKFPPVFPPGQMARPGAGGAGWGRAPLKGKAADRPEQQLADAAKKLGEAADRFLPENLAKALKDVLAGFQQQGMWPVAN